MPQECRQLEETFLHAYVDGEFGAEETAEVQAHLSDCAACTHAVRIHQSYKAAMSRASHEAPQSLQNMLRASLAEEAPDSRWTTAFRDPRGIALTAACVGAAAWFLAGGMQHSVLTKSGQALSRPGSSLADAAAAMHAQALPFDFTAPDVATTQRWLSSQLDFGVQIPRFAQGTQLQGVRLSNFRAHRAAMVSYAITAGGQRVSLLVVDDPEPQLDGAPTQIANRKVFVTRAHGYNVVQWRNDEVVYQLVSDLDQRDVLALVQSAEQR
jgi:anti-sigma factor RsiW